MQKYPSGVNFVENAVACCHGMNIYDTKVQKCKCEVEIKMCFIAYFYVYN